MAHVHFCRKPLNRRYIMVEGIYANTGELAPLDAIVPLKHKCALLRRRPSLHDNSLWPPGCQSAALIGCSFHDYL